MDAPDSLLRDNSLTLGARLVGTLLWRHADASDPERFVFPSTSRLAALSCQNPRSVRRQIEQLLRAEHIQRACRTTVGGERWGWLLRVSALPEHSPPGPTGPLGRADRTNIRADGSAEHSSPGPTGPLERTEGTRIRTDGSAEHLNPGPTGPPERTDGSAGADRRVRRSNHEPTNEPCARAREGLLGISSQRMDEISAGAPWRE